MSQTTKDYQYDRNDNNTFGVRGTASGGGGTEVVANPTLAGTESALTGLQVGETKYKVEQPINVVANPTLAGTESALTGLQVGDTKYKVPVGAEIHTYTSNKTYTSSDTDYMQLREDITNKRAFAVTIDGNLNVFKHTYLVSLSANQNYYYYENILKESGTQVRYKEIIVIITETEVQIGAVNGVGLYTFLGTTSFPTELLTAVNDRGTAKSFVSNQSRYFTTAPVADNTSGYLQFVVLTAEPATYYNGYYYIIAPTT